MGEAHLSIIYNMGITIYRPYLLKIARIFFKIFLNYSLCILTHSLSSSHSHSHFLSPHPTHHSKHHDHHNDDHHDHRLNHHDRGNINTTVRPPNFFRFLRGENETYLRFLHGGNETDFRFLHGGNEEMKKKLVPFLAGGIFFKRLPTSRWWLSATVRWFSGGRGLQWWWSASVSPAMVIVRRWRWSANGGRWSAGGGTLVVKVRGCCEVEVKLDKR